MMRHWDYCKKRKIETREARTHPKEVTNTNRARVWHDLGRLEGARRTPKKEGEGRDMRNVRQEKRNTKS